MVMRDLCAHRLIGWAMGAQLTTTLMQQALRRRYANGRSATLLHHTDRGSQYTSGDWQAMLAPYHITPSLSATGNCHDDALLEGYWHDPRPDPCVTYATLPPSCHDEQLSLHRVFRQPSTHSQRLGYPAPMQSEARAQPTALPDFSVTTVH